MGYKTKKKQVIKRQSIFELPHAPAIIRSSTQKPTSFQEVYSLQEPYVYAAIVKNKENQKICYEIIEPTLQKIEKKYLREMKTLLMDELDANLKEIGSKDKAENYLRKKIAYLIKKYLLTQKNR